MINTAIDHYRSGLRFANTHELSNDHDAKELPSVESRLNYQDLLKLIQNLPTSYRAVFNLFAIDGFGHPEIASMLQISIGASKSNLFKARKKLQELVLVSNNQKATTSEVESSSLNDEMFLKPGF